MRPTLCVVPNALTSKILDEAKGILAEVGVEVRGPRLRERLLDAGAGFKLDAAGERILFPPEVVDAAIASAPRSITLYNRSGEPHAHLAGDNVHFVPGSSGLK
ncbi:MAG: trimethylamine methyltransferase family protein, partial [Anaerolineales bacterium]